jgi:GTP-binding protein YchF
MKLGIVGLPNVGKSTLFNAITKASAKVANYPFCTIAPNVGTVAVPDRRLDFLKKLYNPKITIPATVEFIDIAGLIKGASLGEGLGNKFLAHIRETSAIIHVVRCFENKNITHVMGKIDTLRDIEIIDTELILSDIETISKRLKRLEKCVKINDKKTSAEREFALKIKAHINTGKPVRTLNLNDDEKGILKDFFLITAKPVLYVCNIAEGDLTTMNNNHVEIVKEKSRVENSHTVSLCAKIEAELSELSEEDQKTFLKNFELKESGLNRLIRAGYDLLGLVTFFTVGEDEVKAWTIKRGFLAPQAAGLIHTDFEKGFIRAAVINFDDLVRLNNEKAVKDAGLLKIEGKQYLVKDGDIIEFRFNV